MIKKLLTPTDFLSARYLATRAAILSVLFGIAHFVGLREYTTFISGTSEGADPQLSALLGTIYMGFYFSFTIVVPILLIASGMMFVSERRARSEDRGDGDF